MSARLKKRFDAPGESRKLKFLLPIYLSLLLSLLTNSSLAETPHPSVKNQADITAIKNNARGPFRRLRWFCHDGKILPPKPYACAEPGGVQHGQLTKKVIDIRNAGFLIANLLADYTKHAPDKIIDLKSIKAILLEQFLIGYDDGWIFHNARYYRGAIQSEREIEGAEEIVKWLLANLELSDQNYLLLWEAFRLLPHETNTASSTWIRDQATRLAKLDSGFEKLRAKLHGQPEAADAQRIRQYSASQGKRELQSDYRTLAHQIDRLFSPEVSIQALKKHHLKNMDDDLFQFIKHLPELPSQRLEQGGKILVQLRESFPHKSISQQIKSLQLGELIEQIVFAAGNELLSEVLGASRTQQLGWLRASADTLYGIGMISKRGWITIHANLQTLQNDSPTVKQYRDQLRDLNRVTSWASQWLKFHFQADITHLSQLEPLTTLMIPTRLRGSTLQFYSKILDGLLRDSDQLAGTKSTIFDQISGSGVRALNPGIAQGTLKLAGEGEEFESDNIYLLPETVSTLPPVAGILTLGEGNSVSHIQLLAANLGIPNVAIDDSMRAAIEVAVNKEVFLAVSAGGVVKLNYADTDTQVATPLDEASIIKPDLDKLDLDTKKILRLSNVGNHDSGRIAGPKAARLGELNHLFPGTVVEGLIIPFGYFREFLDQKDLDSSISLFEWMKLEYQLISLVEGKHKKALTRRFLRLLNQKIIDMPFPADLHLELESTLNSVFGASGSYALFVRSDTNIEDLPGFNGAGLNLTVPNVVGFEPLLKAIKRVWASPFTPRAFAWRQGRMVNPEHVYPSILLMKTVPVDKSGVMLTFDTVTGSLDKLTIATNFGIGGAVQGQAAEEMRVDIKTGNATLLADATNPLQRNANLLGGLKVNPVNADGQVLSPDEISQLHQLAKQIEERYPQKDEQGETTIADVEFGFENGELRLFQIRPYLRSRAASNNQYLIELDRLKQGYAETLVDMQGIPL